MKKNLKDGKKCMNRIITFIKKNFIFIIGILIAINLTYYFLNDNGQTEIQKDIIQIIEK